MASAPKKAKLHLTRVIPESREESPIRRPLLSIAVALIGGSILAARGRLDAWPVALALCLGGVILLAYSRQKPRAVAIALILTFTGIGALLWQARHQAPPSDAISRFAASNPHSLTYTIEGTVERPDLVLPGEGYLQFILRADDASPTGIDTSLAGGVLVRWSGPAYPLFPGDRVRVEGPLRLAMGRVNHGIRDVEDYYRSRDVHTRLNLRGPGAVQRISNGQWYSPSYIAARLRNATAARLAQATPEESLPFVLTVWLGDRRRIGETAYGDFVESGTAHILAVSGVHMGIVYLSMTYLLRLFVRHRRARLLMLMAAVLLFAMTAGARVSSLRAAIMILIYLAADWHEREPDAPTALGIAAILFTLHDPDIIFDTGFQLSFSSIASILLFRLPIANRLHRLPHFLRESLSVTLAVQILPLPIAIASFHVIPFAAVLANLIVIPALSVVLWLCFVGSGILFIVPAVGLLFLHAAHPVIQFIFALTARVADYGATHAYATSPSALAIALYFAAAGLLYLAAATPGFNPRRGLAAATLLLAAVLFWSPHRPGPAVDFLDVGHGDATVIRTPAGATILVDAGDRSEFVDYGKRVVAPFLWANGITRLDAVVVTHPDRDHIGGVPFILDHFNVGALLLGPLSASSDAELGLIEQCRNREIPIQRLARGDAVRIPGADFDVLHPPADWPATSSVNDASLTLRVHWPGFSLLLPGDIEATGESALASQAIRSDILKVPHHGSRTSSSDAFIDAVDPRFAAISVGMRGRRTVLHPDVMIRYRDRGAIVARTDILGGLRITQNAQGQLHIIGAREQRAYPIRLVN